MTENKNTGPVVEIEITADGSHTLFVPALKEHYHSVFGSIAESRHIFINSGFNFLEKKETPVEILEIGFGTGLNALLTYIESESGLRSVNYAAIELNPLSKDIYERLNYPDLVDHPSSRKIFLDLHQSIWDELVKLTGHFSLLKRNISMYEYSPAAETFDLVYFDAFGPDVQPEMWTEEVFRKIASGLRKDGILVTYSSKGTVKRNLKAAGFKIEKLPGPAGKREILRAFKIC
jgi:tRNA U34 5-methylaminomethyl-2-thiouridine-forming methyltransferase MnmC